MGIRLRIGGGGDICTSRTCAFILILLGGFLFFVFCAVLSFSLSLFIF